MITSLPALLSAADLSDTFSGGRAPCSWQRQVASRVKPARDSLSCFAWVKTVELDPKIMKAPLLGRCLQQEIFNAPEEDEQRQLATETSPKRRGGIGNQHRETSGKPSAMPDAVTRKRRAVGSLLRDCVLHRIEDTEPGQGNSTVSGSLQQCAGQPKKIGSAMLKQWCGEKPVGAGARQDRPDTSTENKSPLQKIPAVSQPIEKRKRQVSHLPPRGDLECWRKQVEEAVAGNLARSGKRATVAERHRSSPRTTGSVAASLRSDKSAWQKPLMPGCGDYFLSTEQLFQLQQGRSITQTAAANDKGKENRARPGADSGAGQPALSGPGTAPALAEEGQPDRQVKTADTAPAGGQKIARKAGASRDSGQMPSQAASDPFGLIDVDLSPPQHPPLRKEINEALQPSGKRTPLTSETRLLPANLPLEDEDLAEAFKRIIDQEARRHGIDV